MGTKNNPQFQSRCFACLEMICADFLARSNLDNGDPKTLVFSMKRFFGLLPEARKPTFL